MGEANANLAKAKADVGAPGEQNAQVRLAKANVRSAQLNLDFTQQKAPVDSYVTNLNLRLGSQAVENQPIMALVDVYDALVSSRVYKTAHSHDEAVEQIAQEQGGHFDPDVVDAFTGSRAPSEEGVDQGGEGRTFREDDEGTEAE